MTLFEMLRFTLRRAGGVVLIVIAGCYVSGAAFAEDFCALSVEVQFHDGSPARLTPVRLVDPSGKVVFDEQAEKSTFRICDFGFGPHSLVVGYGFCYPTTVSGLELHLGRPIHLMVRLNECPPHVSRGSCSVYLRARSPSGSALENVSVSWGTGGPPGATDAYGRVGTSLVGPATTTAILTKEGYIPESIALHCTKSEGIEREIVLKPVAP